jgi:hypothetical protein
MEEFKHEDENEFKHEDENEFEHEDEIESRNTDPWYEQFGAPTNNPKAYKKWEEWKKGHRAQVRISGSLKMTSPDKKSVIEIRSEKGTDNICIQESPKVCQIVPDPTGAVAWILAEGYWHDGWTVERGS